MSSASVTLVVPAASAREDPAWSSFRPDGAITLVAVLKPLDVTNVSRVVVVVLKEHVDAKCGGDAAGLQDYLAAQLGFRSGGGAAEGESGKPALQVVALEQPTTDAVQTVCEAITRCGIEGPLFVKDCDGAFPHKVAADDHVVVLPITSQSVTSLHDLPSKSFAYECGGILTNIVEKQIVSDLACVGGYGFASAAEFVAAQARVRATAELAKKSGSAVSGSVFTSHVALQLLFEESVFRVVKVGSFEDWKTPAAWAANSKQYRNFVAHLDDGLVRPKVSWLAAKIREQAGSYTALSELYEPVQENIDTLRHAVEGAKGDRTIILSSHTEAQRAAIMSMLGDFGIPCDALVLGANARGTGFVLEHGRIAQESGNVLLLSA